MKREVLVLSFLAWALAFCGALPAARAQEGEYAGDATCIECHEEIAAAFARTSHGIVSDRRSPAGKFSEFACESCHGPGLTHAEEGEGGNILRLAARSAESAEQKSAVCQQCHARGKVALWHTGTHSERGLSCSDCHSVHGGNRRYLRQARQEELCGSCHRAITPQLVRRSHHPIREGKVSCSDCHNAHGTIADKLVDAQYANLKCFECHARTRGPFLWEHPPAVENCLSCHRPHGSNYDNLLNAKTPFLCQRCHSSVSHSGALQARTTAQGGRSVYRSLGNLGYYRACLNCHVAVHGSNHPSGKSLLR